MHSSKKIYSEVIKGIENLKRFMDKYEQKRNDNRITTTNLEIALKLSDINCDKETVNRIVDLVNLLEIKGDDTTLMDISKLKAKWLKK